MDSDSFAIMKSGTVV